MGPFALGKCDQALTGKTYRRFSIGLRAKPGVVGGGPLVDLGEVIFVHQFSQSPAPVVAEAFCFGRAAGDKFRQVR